MSKLRWQDMVNVVLGLWIAASPWVHGVGDEMPPVIWNAVVVGVLILVLAAIDLDAPANWEEWVLGALGLWMVISPWVIGYAANRAMMASSVVAGALVAALAAWALYAAGGFTQHRGTAH